MKRVLFALSLLLSLSIAGISQESVKFNKAEIVTTLADIMEQNYVFPDKGKDMASLLKKRLEAGDYEALKEASAFAQVLESDLRSIIDDGHLRVLSNAERVDAVRNRRPAGVPNLPEDLGFHTVEILEGNIGYLDLRMFLDVSVAGEKAKESMDKLIQADALIFDVRNNGGGAPSMVRFLANYVLENKPVHLNTFYWRPTDQRSELWTVPEQASVHKTDIPVFILTSNRTGSAAEGFSYHLKHLERATIVGETTAGAAHPGGYRVLDDSFLVFVPQGRPTNPVTQSNWEGQGVIPHVKVPQDEAFDKALELARKALAKKGD